jgi:hypothetical protein
MNAPNSNVPRYADAFCLRLTTSAENVDDSECKPACKPCTSSECNTDWLQTDQSLPDHNTESPMYAQHAVQQFLPHDAQLDTQTHAARPPKL